MYIIAGSCFYVNYCWILFLASEWKSFLFFYIPVVLFCILKDQYYVHAFLLVKAIRILLSCNITENDLQVAQQLLEKFCSGMEMLYGNSNVHM